MSNDAFVTHGDNGIKLSHWHCPKHGVQPVVGLEISLVSSVPPARKDVSPAYLNGGTKRVYCLECWIALFDAHCEQLTPIDGAEDAR